MNSISYLDSVLTRSLTTSRTASGSNTPASEEDGHRLNRRASDYLLSRERERERRRIALSLGLSTLDADHDPVGQRRSSKSSKSSKRSSRHSSTKNSETEGGSERKSSDRLTGSGHPKSSSESKVTEGRRRLNRAGSTPAPTRTLSSSAKWGGLWGLGGWLEGSESHDSYSRRGFSSSYDGNSRLERASSSSTKGSKGTRRASTSDADGAFVSISPESLLSERERENVVDFEGYDPEEDLHPSPGSNAPPSTPFPSTSTTTTPTKERPRREGSGMSTGSRISSLLFGALNPLTDDYFGPQPSPNPTPPQQRRKKSEDGTMSGERKRQRSQKLQDSPTKTLNEKTALLLNVTAREQGGESSKEVGTTLPLEPPPPYSDVASSVSSNSLLLPSPDLDVLRGANASVRGIRRRRAITLVVRGVKGALKFLRRLILTIILAPVRIIWYFRRRSGQQAIEVEVRQESNVERQSSGKFHTSSQAERPSAARHVAGRRRSADDSSRLDDEGSSSEEIVTEDQAEARARRKAAARKEAEAAASAAAAAAAIAEEEAAVERKTNQVKTLTTPGGSRLLPNPNPIHPLLAHDRDAKPSSELIQVQERPKPLNAGMIANRGPLSSLIHHSPKVLVLDLDETLIHSTSRSPTWGALTDKSKGRMAVTTGGSLLGLEGLGGVMGLRGQVGVRPHQVEVVLDGRSIIYHVYKRPHVDHFLRKVAAWYHVVIFTASVQEYADPVIDWLDQGRGLVGTRLFRESCTFRNGSYQKNLAHVDADLSRVCLVDNSPASYTINQGEWSRV